MLKVCFWSCYNFSVRLLFEKFLSYVKDYPIIRKGAIMTKNHKSEDFADREFEKKVNDLFEKHKIKREQFNPSYPIKTKKEDTYVNHFITGSSSPNRLI